MEYFKHIDRARENIDGAFYSVSIGVDCGCGLPEQEAPELLKTKEDRSYQTYFFKQPDSPIEIEMAISAINICGIHDLRYGGTDPNIIRKVRSGQSDYIINRGGQVVLASEHT